MLKVSVVIPTHNRRNVLTRALKALFTQSYPVDNYEVIVVDDGSTDDTSGYLATVKAPCEFSYYKQPKSGAAAARNLGVKKAKGELILFIDDDIVADGNLIAEHVKAHVRPHLAVLGYTPVSPEVKENFVVGHYINRWNRLFAELEKDPQNVRFSYFMTGNISVLKEDLERVGLFDESIATYSFEDTEMGYRLSQAGVKLVFNKKAIAYHLIEVSLEKMIDYKKQAGRSAVVCCRRHPELREEMSIDYALKKFVPGDSWFRKLKKMAKRVLINGFSIWLLKRSLPVLEFLGFESVYYYFFSLIGDYYYGRGIRKALQEKNLSLT